MPHRLPGGTDPNNPAATGLDPSSGMALLQQLLGSTDLGQIPGLIESGFTKQFRNPFGGPAVGVSSIENPADALRALNQAVQRSRAEAGRQLRGVAEGPAADVSGELLATQQGLGEQEIVRQRGQQRLRGGQPRGFGLPAPPPAAAPPKPQAPTKGPLSQRLPSIEEQIEPAEVPPQIRALQKAIQAGEEQERQENRRQQQLRANPPGFGPEPDRLRTGGFVTPGGFGPSTNNLSAMVLGNPGELPFDNPEQAFALTLGAGGPNAARKASTLDLARATVYAWSVSRNIDRVRERERRISGAVEAIESGDAGFGQGLRGLGTAFGEEGLNVLRRLRAGESLEDISGAARNQLQGVEKAEQRMKENLLELSRRQSQASKPRAQSRPALQREIRKREAKLYERVAEEFDIESLFGIEASDFGLTGSDALSSFLKPADAEALLAELAGGTSAQEIADRIRGKQQMQAELQRRQRFGQIAETRQINQFFAQREQQGVA